MGTINVDLKQLIADKEIALAAQKMRVDALVAENEALRRELEQAKKQPPDDG